MKTLLVAAVILLGACSPLDLLKTGVPDISAQVGNETAVDTGVGKIGDSTKIHDSTGTTISSGKYHLEAKDNLTINIHETNKWVMPLIGLYIFGRPLALWLVRRLIKKIRRNDG